MCKWEKKINNTYTLKADSDIDKLKKDFINKANLKYKYAWKYDKVDYKGLDIPVIITCPVHGDFEVTPHTHLRPSS